MEAPVFEPITRPSVPFLDERLGVPAHVLDHGFVRVIDYMGDEAAVVQAARVSYGKGTKTVSDDRGLIRYLISHKHSTPLEMCEIKLHMKLPVFVARQWIRHRTASVNEYSARYSILDREFYLPGPEEMARQSKTNNQGRSTELLDSNTAREIREQWQREATQAYLLYEAISKSLDDGGEVGLARELARIGLPLSIYTQWYWKVDLHNLMHLLRLRMDSHAQYEIRVYADTIARFVQGWVPHVWEAFEDYVLEAHTFSRQQMRVLRDLVEDRLLHVDDAVLDDLTAREKRELISALRRN